MMRLIPRTCPVAVMALLVAGLARAQMVPRTLPFTATVKTASGDPLPDAPVAITFNIYGEAGTLIWTDTQTVTPSHGVVTTQIAVPDPPRFSQAYRLGVKVGSDPEMTPLLPFGAAPYAMALPNVFVNRSNLHVGVGTSNPNTDLEVATSATGGGIRLTGLANANPALQFFQGTTAAGDLGLAAAPGDFSVDALAGDVVLRASTGRVLLQNGTESSALIIAGNRVGIGAAPDGAARLTVAGEIRSSTGGFRFPDGTTQTTAQLRGATGPAGPPGPQGPAGPRGPVAGETPLPGSSGLVGPLSLRLFVGQTESLLPIRLVQPFSMTFEVKPVVKVDPKGHETTTKSPGRLTFGPLVLSRPAALVPRTDWYDWSLPDDRDAYPTHDVRLELHGADTALIGSWLFPACPVSRYEVQLNTDGQAVEQITLQPLAMTRQLVQPRGLFPVRGIGVAFPPVEGTLQVTNSPALVSDAQLVVFPDPRDPPRLVLSNRRSLDLHVRVPLTQSPDLYPWFLTGLDTVEPPPNGFHKEDAILTVPDYFGDPSFTLTAKQTWASQYSLVPCEDGGVVEDYNLVSEGLTRP